MLRHRACAAGRRTRCSRYSGVEKNFAERSEGDVVRPRVDIPYEQINLGQGYDSPNQPWYLKMNPTGTIPTIEDDGFVLWESERDREVSMRQAQPWQSVAVRPA